MSAHKFNTFNTSLQGGTNRKARPKERQRETKRYTEQVRGTQTDRERDTHTVKVQGTP